ncbi:MAG: nucleotidyltransferase domain-containing protein [Nanoarchaeota archaeon]
MKEKGNEKKNNLADIKPGNVPVNYQSSPPMQNSAQAPQIDFNALKDKLENFKKAVIKKYNFTMALVLLPSQAYPLFEEDEALPKEVVESKPIHMIMVIPEEQYKNLPKIKPEVVKLAKETKENLWVHIKTELDLWNYGLDSKYELLDATAQGYPIYDKGFLGALRVASIHKSLVLRKFDKYVATYVVAGSLVRGTAGKDSDVDVFVIIDDTDVKRMSRVELLERLRGMIHEYIREATALAGVKNILNVQVYLLTDFWQSVKDAHPVMFTFIRDGIPLWDRGTFIPWKLLLKMGKIKPSPEAIDLYMKQGEQTQDFVKRRLLDAMVDIYYGILTPTQSMTMLAGEGPEVPKNIVTQVRRLFVEKEKLMDEKNLKILEKAVHLFKQYEYGKLKEYPGKDLDVFLKECLEYNKMLRELRTKLEKRVQEKSTEEVYEEVFKLLKTIFGNKSQAELIKEFENKMIKKGKMQSRFSNVIKELVNAKGKVKSGKINQKDADNVKRDAFDLMEALVEYAQRADLVQAKKGAMQISYNGRKAELLLLGEHNFLIEGKEIKKIENGKLVAIKEADFQKAFNENKGKITTKVSGEVFNTLKHVLGDFDIEF